MSDKIKKEIEILAKEYDRPKGIDWEVGMWAKGIILEENLLFEVDRKTEGTRGLYFRCLNLHRNSYGDGYYDIDVDELDAVHIKPLELQKGDIICWKDEEDKVAIMARVLDFRYMQNEYGNSSDMTFELDIFQSDGSGS